jgi:hypothetical protein
MMFKKDYFLGVFIGWDSESKKKSMDKTVFLFNFKL